MPADTFRAWERRYGVPQPSRTPGNQRLYSDREIATIGWLRDRTRTGVTISQAVRLLRSSDRALALTAAPTYEGLGPAAPGNGAFARQRREVIESLARFEATRANRAVEEALALGSVEDVCLHVLQPVLVEVGEHWERGECPVSTEHFATAFVLRKLGALYNLSRPDAGRGPIVAGCLEGELHEVGLLLTCLFLSRRGYRVVYLGPNLPLPDLIAAANLIRPMLVLLSTSTVEGAERLIAGAERLTDHAEDENRFGNDAPQPVDDRGRRGLTPPVIGFGGRVFACDLALRARVPGLYLGSDADEALASVDRMFADNPA